MAPAPDTGGGNGESFKQQLDRVADEGSEQQEQQRSGIGAKITQYIPGASKILAQPAQQQSPATAKSEMSGPPNRPDHDDKIEEFVRDQHRSKEQASALGQGGDK